MLNIKYFKRFLMVLLLGNITNSHAVMIVEDPIAIARLADQIIWLEDQYETLIDQYETLEKQYEAVTGANDNSELFEEVLNIGKQYDFWDWTPDLDDLEDMVNGGYQVGSLSDRIEYYNKKYGTPHSEEDFVAHSPDNSTAVFQADQAIYSRAGMSVGHESFDRANEFHDAYEQQRSKTTEHLTQKQAIDYTNQLLLQITAILNEILKLEAMQLQIVALTTKGADTTNEFNSQFFTSSY